LEIDVLATVHSQTLFVVHLVSFLMVKASNSQKKEFAEFQLADKQRRPTSETVLNLRQRKRLKACKIN